MPYGPRNESTSREWLLVIAAGFTVLLVDEETGMGPTVGTSLVVAGLAGLGWKHGRKR
ncbi:hypothetical protein H9L10_03605 [Phycicoccus endophyticus]|uniref:Uncharacterized protein n=1 Tax=Phycicoccus endophyticus TaxID=1690220 RepID=A0A7G9R3I0_9MICO|nr:hypothetical protein [Phycicoccus endophyticus]NHI19911.1 hypothetical protein [Phycicoccus endophyticus]QNN50155.1 hypothetical protein H9L10_03605 [Phycicoccus endophyticus]